MKIFLSNLGCVRNRVDGELMLGRLAAAGHEIVDDPETAGVIVVNTCGFIDSAADESIDTILSLAEFKSEGDCERLIVTGCLSQRYGPDSAEAMPEVDVFLGTGSYNRIEDAINGKCMPDNLFADPDALPLQNAHSPRVIEKGPTAYLKVTEGCNRRCTYCIIPKLRGRLRSRPKEDVVAEARMLAESGFSEIIIIGQDTTSYGRDLDKACDFADLLDAIADAASPAWVRFLYGHPDGISAALLQTMANHANICPYLDVPVQHASDRILKKMGRTGNCTKLHELFENIRSSLPGAAVRTTFMVGFPGETDRDFKELMEFAEKIKFENLGAFIYSDGEDLPSHGLENHVPAKTAEKRHALLMKKQAEISRKINEARIGKTYAVLVEESLEPGLYSGRTMFQAPEVDGLTFIDAVDLTPGEFADVRITDAFEYDLKGVPA
ncbi:MAG: 30S ribosomal protein S12 methylthiotransferase RimO [Deltaproteobacteria bacterium]|nr:30S ribosomal protein S12 methylthiotransferase RimO [Deltaproteobacteria bacterium]